MDKHCKQDTNYVNIPLERLYINVLFNWQSPSLWLLKEEFDILHFCISCRELEEMVDTSMMNIKQQSVSLS